MFTGLITATGRVTRVSRDRGGLDIDIAAPYRGLALGESIAVDGACLTVARKVRGGFGVRAIATTVERTLFGSFTPGTRVNLERALSVGDRLGGHLVQGHVDGVGTIRARKARGDAVLLDVKVPAAVFRVSVPLGSITIQGVSLTVNAVRNPGIIQVSLIPHTLGVTTLGEVEPGSRVHVEGDVIGKYLESMSRGWRGSRAI